MPDPIYISSIVVPNPNVPLRDRNGTADFAINSYKIWDYNNRNKTQPCSIALSSSNRSELHVTIGATEPFDPNRSYKLSCVFADPCDGGPRFEDVYFNINDTEVIVPIVLKGYSSTVPWGVKDDITWTIDDQYPTTMKLELYAIAPQPLLPTYFQNEIPSEFLELFVLPTAKAKIKDYVPWAVAVCHRSKHDHYDNPKVPFNFTAVHSYIYNHLGAGSPSFTGEYGGSFDLEEWLNSRGGNGPKYNVNCFDQAGLVIIALSLGRTDIATEFQWFHMRPYGYINGDLVGCGMCNNPFFGGKGSNPETSPLLVTQLPNEDGRSGFGRHVFAAVATGDRLRMIDACCGPHVGDEDKYQYIEAAVDKSNTPKKYEAGTAADAKTDADWGIDTLDRPVHNTYQFESLSESEQKFINELEAASLVEGSKGTDRMDKVNLASLVDQITAKLQLKQFGEPKKSASRVCTHVQWTSLHSEEAVSVDMTIYKNYGEAFKAWNHHFRSFTDPESHIKSLSGQPPKSLKATHYLAGADSVQWVDSHIVVKLTRSALGGSRDIDLDPIAHEIHTVMSTATPDHADYQEVSKIHSVASTGQVAVGEEFFVTLEVCSGECSSPFYGY